MTGELAGQRVIRTWLKNKKMQPFDFQEKTWEAVLAGHSGLLNAPTGCGKTFSVFLAALIQFINENPDSYKTKKNNGLQLLWVTPLKALGKDIARAMENSIAELGLLWKVGIRNGDTSTKERALQKKQIPEILIITPESLHLLLAQKNYPGLLSTLRIIAVDEWHELLGSKRGVQIELAVSRIVGLKIKKGKNQYPTDGHSLNTQNITHNTTSSIKSQQSKIKNKKTANVHSLNTQHLICNTIHESLNMSIWGLSATIGNLSEAMDVLMAPIRFYQQPGEEPAGIMIQSGLSKKIRIASIFPDEIEKYPWAGHLGLKLAQKVLPVIEAHRGSLIFINTRGMSEMWYQQLLNIAPELSGALALHHGSIDKPLRIWVEDALHEGKLQAVVCTASLDLGVDFRPVEAIVQVGSPKAVARFLQRAGRSGHQPGAESVAYFLPTHSLELLEVAALKEAIHEQAIESREPMLLCFDVLLQYLCTLAVSDGFNPEQIIDEIRSTYCYKDIREEEWQEILNFLVHGGKALQQYDDYKKVDIGDDGIIRIISRKMAMRHRMSVGTIVSDAMMKVKLMHGGYIGAIEEYFISKLNPGDVFTLAGRNLEFIMIKDMTVLVRKSSSKKSIVPSWMGGRMPLSSSLGALLRKKLDDVTDKHRGHVAGEEELQALDPLFGLQQELSHLPRANELLIEHIETKDGFHLFVYPFEGRLVHEAMAALLAFRISRIMPVTFSIAMNDYGFELLSDQPIPLDDSNVYELFSEENLYEQIQQSVNATEMARRKFRDIAVIGGLLFQGMPGELVKQKHLQSSASLLFNVFSNYDPDNILLRQAYREVMEQQMEESRLRDMLKRIAASRIVITYPKELTPFCFPIKVDSLRETISSEQLEDRVRKMISMM